MKAESEEGTPRGASLSSPTRAQNGVKRTHAESFSTQGNEASAAAPAAVTAAVTAAQTAEDGSGTAGRQSNPVKLEPVASPRHPAASEQCRPHDDLSQATKRVKVEPV